MSLIRRELHRSSSDEVAELAVVVCEVGGLRAAAGELEEWAAFVRHVDCNLGFAMLHKRFCSHPPSFTFKRTTLRCSFVVQKLSPSRLRRSH